MTGDHRILGAVLALPPAMFALAFASKPLYDTFCRVTGFGGTTSVATESAHRIIDREILVRFDANVSAGVPVRFDPAQDSMRVKLGQTALAYFELDNLTDRSVELVASYNVTPHKTGVYFRKLQCFCFERTTFPPGTDQRLPVLFYIDPDLDTSERHDDVRSITLSYTFFRADQQSQEKT